MRAVSTVAMQRSRIEAGGIGGGGGGPPAWTAGLLVAVLAACAHPGPPEAAAGAPGKSASGTGTPVGSPTGAVSTVAASAAASPIGRPDNASLEPFRKVVAGATRTPGYFPIWQKYDRVWIEVPADRVDRPFFFSYNISDSIGERFAYASQMGRRFVVHFHRVGNAMQLVARNTQVVAAEGSPAERAVRQGFTDSLLASAPVVSQPSPDRDAVLVDASALLVTDLPGYSTVLESSFRINYSLDRANSSFTRVQGDNAGASFSVRAHFSTPRLPGLGGGVSPPAVPPDARSVFVGFVYNLAPLPEPMRPRYADDRVGTFTTAVADYGDDASPSPRRFFVNRWRLEKQHPEEPLSDPKQPIVFWIDRNVPVAYRQTVAEGVLAWNAAFARIGISNALVVRIQPDDADFDTLDSRHASIRWYLGADAGYAIGPSHTDPRTGEILDADIAIPDTFTRGARSLIGEALPQAPKAFADARDAGAAASARCDYAAEAVGEAAFAMGLLDARGDVPADSVEAERFVRDYLRSVVTHEVGHALGLRHNFRASTIHSEAELQDAAFTRTHGVSGSVMDYTPFNIAARGERQGEYVMSGLGPYDFWAIEYAYRPLDAASPEAERPLLARLAARGGEPELAFATDEDASAGPDGMDPDINRFDLGSDPLAYLKKRFALSRELWQRLQSRPMRADESYLVLRRNVERGFNEIGHAAPLIAKYVGGVHIGRSHAGYNAQGLPVSLMSGAALYTNIDAARQRQALDLLATQLFSAESFRFDPEFVRRLGVDHLDSGWPDTRYRDSFYLPGRVLGIQTAVLDQLLSDPVARRIGNGENTSSRPRDLLTLAQLYASLQQSIWSELSDDKEISAMRRNLQREHLKRVVGVLLRPTAPTLADARSLQRENVIDLRARIVRSLAHGRWSAENRAHLGESVATIDSALKAPLIRDGA